MYGYKADFVHDGKVMMKISRDPALQSAELDMHAIKMMQRHPIPQMLTLDVREVDFNVELYFDISGKKMLQQLFRSEKITEMQLYEWLLQLMRMVEDCRSYMLHPNQLLLHEQFIFIEGGIAHGLLYIPYIPIQEALHENSMMESICRLAIQLSGSVTTWQGDTFQQMVRMLHDGSYSITQVRQFVQTAISKPPVTANTQYGREASFIETVTERPKNIDYNNRDAISKASHSWNDTERSNLSWQSNSVQFGQAQAPTKHAAETKRSNLHQINNEQMNTLHAANNVERESFLQSSDRLDSAELQYRNQLAWPEPDSAEDSGELLPLESQSPIIGASIAVIISVLGWKFGYMESRDFIGLILSSSATLIALFMGFSWWKGWLVGMVSWFQKSNDRDKFKSGSKRWSVSPATGMLPDFASVELSSTVLPSTSNNDRITPKFAVSPPDVSPIRAHKLVSLETHYDDMLNHTTLMDGGQIDATTLLDSSSAYSETNDPIIFTLERLGPDETSIEETITITEWPFVIGRGSQGIHHSLSLMGISKLHCELNKVDDQYVIQDLGSKNGTELQDDMLIPYKKYPLHEGDRIRIIEYVYRVSMRRVRTSKFSHVG